MLKKIKNKKNVKRNTLKLKYETSLEEEIKVKDKLIKLQDKVITLQQENETYKKIIIEELRKDIVKEKQKYKKLKEKYENK